MGSGPASWPAQSSRSPPWPRPERRRHRYGTSPTGQAPNRFPSTTLWYIPPFLWPLDFLPGNDSLRFLSRPPGWHRPPSQNLSKGVEYRFFRYKDILQSGHWMDIAASWNRPYLQPYRCSRYRPGRLFSVRKIGHKKHRFKV